MAGLNGAVGGSGAQGMHGTHGMHGTQGAHEVPGAANGRENGHRPHGTLRSYVIGFLLSIVLTVIPVAAVAYGGLGRAATLVVILAAAALQFVVQLLFFMHLREGENKHWNIMALLLGVVMLVMVVGGSIWIMTHNAVAH